MKCAQGEECVNTQGSFHCLKTSRPNSASATSSTVLPPFLGQSLPDYNRHCPAGFRYDTQRRRCFGIF
jgi:hypothetical protein